LYKKRVVGGREGVRGSGKKEEVKRKYQVLFNKKLNKYKNNYLKIKSII
jgi:hypothetical protein